MTGLIKKTISALFIGLIIGAGSMYLLLSGCETKKENAILKEQVSDRNERDEITADIVSGNEQTRRNIQETTKAINANTEKYISSDDNIIMPAGAIWMHDDTVLQRLPYSSGIADAGTTGTETDSQR